MVATKKHWFIALLLAVTLGGGWIYLTRNLDRAQAAAAVQTLLLSPNTPERDAAFVFLLERQTYSASPRTTGMRPRIAPDSFSWHVLQAWKETTPAGHLIRAQHTTPFQETPILTTAFFDDGTIVAESVPESLQAIRPPTASEPPRKP